MAKQGRGASVQETVDMADIDIDGVAECVDILRGAGYTETTDPDVCEATLLLLSHQNR